MKKILLTSALLGVVSTSSIHANTLPNMDNMYVKVSAFTAIGAKVDSDNTDLYGDNGVDKYGDTTFNGTVAVGFTPMEQVRAELSASYLTGPEYSAGNKVENSGWVAYLNGYVEAVDLSSAKLSVGGGLGVSMLETTTTTVSSSPTEAVYEDDFAFSWNVGANLSFDVTPEAAFELGYSYANYGKPGQANDTDWAGDSRASHNLSLGLKINM